MDMIVILEIASNLATVLATFVAIITVREMINDRKSARQPLLIIRNNEQLIQYNTIPDSFWRQWTNIQRYYDKKESATPKCKLDLENIGLGVAKDIEVEWTIKYQNTIKFLIEKDKGFKLNGFFGEPDLSYINPDNSHNSPMYICDLNYNETEKQKVEYLSANIDGTYKDKIGIPNKFFSLINCLISYGDDTDYMHIDCSSKEFPKLSCRISYKDIADVKYSKKYNIEYKLENGTPKEMHFNKDDSYWFDEGYDGPSTIPIIVFNLV